MTTKQSIDPTILEKAADWLVLLHSGEMTEQQQLEFQQWQQQHPDHLIAIERATRFNKNFANLPNTLDINQLLNSKTTLQHTILKKFIWILSPVVATWLAYQYLPWQLWQADLSSKTGEVKSITLEDGSSLTLGSNSYVNLHFNDTIREIELIQGEIYIETAKQPPQHQRPFMVETQSGAIQALGTQFSVQQNKPNSPILVQVFQHAVAIAPDQQTHRTILQQGEMAQFDQNHILKVEKLQQTQPYWTQHILVVENKPLDQVLAEIYHYRHGQYFIDEATKSIKVSGVFSLRNTQQSIETLAQTYDLKLNYYSEYVLYVSK
ncbi:MAG: FecR domain-containing protein [Acinetobacter populi]|jgi:transmembrane sensor|uniref:FecR family protein n=1 Tax=Acinetobacter populi TaxID=1582270 RepID=UPI0023526380|nr:FecR domain-containing protein [Acinetobacter populi]MCH4248673.1 FecR domain-containing protein [Acinetobacter populi]